MIFKSFGRSTVLLLSLSLPFNHLFCSISSRENKSSHERFYKNTEIAMGPTWPKLSVVFVLVRPPVKEPDHHHRAGADARYLDWAGASNEPRGLLIRVTTQTRGASRFPQSYMLLLRVRTEGPEGVWVAHFGPAREWHLPAPSLSPFVL